MRDGDQRDGWVRITGSASDGGAQCEFECNGNGNELSHRPTVAYGIRGCTAEVDDDRRGHSLSRSAGTAVDASAGLECAASVLSGV